MKSDRQIIALCGPAGCGKTTLADQLIDNHRFIRLSFAAPIREMLKTLLNLQGVHRQEINRMLYGDLKEVPSEFLSGRTPRHAMQTLGSEWRDLIATNLWTNIWKKAATYVPRIVVDDMRFTHEASVIRDLGGKIIRLDRPGCAPGTHSSEQDYLNIVPDFIITNDANPQALLVRLIETGILNS